MKISVDLTHYLDFVMPVYKKLYTNKERYNLLVGSASSGKSYAVAQFILYETLIRKMHRVLCVRNVYNTIRDSCYKQFVSVIQKQNMGDLFEYSSAPHAEPYIKCKVNNNEILFKGLDDVSKIKSITDVTMIWMEEATEVYEHRDFLQLNLRLRYNCNYLRFILTCNPTDPQHWIKTKIIDTLNLQHNKCKSDYFYLHTNYQDNIYLSEDVKASIDYLADNDPYYDAVYRRGEWCRLDQNSIFNIDKLNKRIPNLPTYKQGIMSTNKFVFSDEGYIKVYMPPIKTHYYVISMDTKTSGADYFAIQVIDSITKEQVATMHIDDITEYEVVQQVYYLGLWYNKALIIIERNHTTYPTNKLEEMNYPNLYRDSAHNIGIFTSSANRPAMISNLIEIVNEHIELLNDEDTLREMFDFVRDKKGKPQAVAGKHDDLIMALGIAYFYLKEQNDKENIPSAPTRAYLAGVRNTKNVNSFNDWS